MAYTTPRTWAAGEYPTAAQFNENIRDNVAFLANPPACRVRHNTTQSIAHSTLQNLVFNTEEYDTDSMHSTSSNTDRVVINTAGLYLIQGGVELVAATDYTRIDLFIRKNDHATDHLKVVRDADPGTANVSRIHEISCTAKFAVNDYVTFAVVQVNGASAARNASSTATWSPQLSVTWVGLG